MNDKLQVRRLCEDAKLPRRATYLSAGYDIYSIEDMLIPPRLSASVGTGIAIRMPKDERFLIHAQIHSRSGYSFRYNMETGAGIIDADYEGELRIKIYNHDDKNILKIKKGDRIAQLVLIPCLIPETEEVSEFEPLANNDRTGGFGSTGY